MEYASGKIGRVVVARLSEGDDLYACIESLAAKENIRCAALIAVGGLRKAKVVVGPKNPRGPIEPQFRQFDDAREIVGAGTIFPDEDTKAPKMHFHAGIGRGKETIVGCPRGDVASVFCVLEVVILEIEGVNARRELDPQFALKLLRVK